MPSKSEALQNAWLFGWTPVAKSLFLAGKALKNETLSQFSKDLCSKFIENEPTFFLEESSFCLGTAGFISTLYPIAKELNDLKLLQVLQSLEEKCINLFDTGLVFGFPQHSMGMDEIPFQIESPSLASGAAGIGLSLLIAEDKFSHNLFF